jgi:glucosamine-phosphate N-acetyltransferase
MPTRPKINFIVRELEEGDLQKGFFQTLSNLAEVGEISKDLERMERIFKEIKANTLYKIFVAVKDDEEVVGLTTLLIEQKFIHNGGKVGHIEDVVTRKEYEGMGIGSALIRESLKFAKEKNCYKVILDCSESNLAFYEKLGFTKHSVNMRYDIK